MKTFSHYLQQEKYSESTVKSYNNTVEKFTDWCRKYGASAEEIDYKTFLKYVQYLQNKQVKKTTVKHQLGALKIYFKYLVF